MIKKYLCFIATLIVITLLVPMESHANSYIPKKRVVVIVYDDSGSMWSKNDEQGNEILIDNWKYANFSLQSFVALLDEGDELIVIPMSDPDSRYDININTSKRSQYIDATKQIQGKGNTPISTIDSAIERLEEEMKMDKNAEFWMIVLTDGIFNELNTDNVSQDTYEQQRESTKGALETFKEKVNNDRILFRSVLVTIESYLSPSEIKQMEQFKQMWNDSIGGVFIAGKKGEDILAKMEQVAALITNRDPKNKHGYELPAAYDKNSLLLQSPFPLRRITLIQQSTNKMQPIAIKQVNINGNSQAHLIDGPYILKTMEDPEKISEDLFSYITHLKHKQAFSVLPAGNYVLTFNHHADDIKENLTILAEPAIDFTVKFFKKKADGSFTDDSKEFYIGDDMQVEVTLYKSGSKNEVLDLSSLGDVKKLVTVKTKLMEVEVPLQWDEQQSKFIGIFSLDNSVDYSTSTVVNIKGFYYKEKDKQLPRKELRMLSLEILTDQWFARVGELEKSKPFKILPLVNGKPMEEDELAQLLEKKHVQINTGDYNINAKVDRDGNIIIVKPLPYKIEKLTSAGDVLMTLSLQGKTPDENTEVQFTLMIEDIPFLKKWGPTISLILFALVFLIYIYGIITKHRFKRNSEYMEYSFAFSGTENELHTSTQHLKSNFFSRYLVPFWPEKCHIDHLTFKASKNGVVLPKEQQRSDMEVAGRKLYDDAGKKDIPLFANDEIKFEDLRHVYTFQYKKN